MGAYRMLIGISVVLILVVGGFLLLDSLLLNEDSTDNAIHQQISAACETTIDNVAETMRVGETRDVPDNCFEDGESLTERLPRADPGDAFRKTEDGLETVSQE